MRYNTKLTCALLALLMSTNTAFASYISYDDKNTSKIYYLETMDDNGNIVLEEYDTITELNSAQDEYATRGAGRYLITYTYTDHGINKRWIYQTYDERIALLYRGDASRGNKTVTYNNKLVIKGPVTQNRDALRALTQGIAKTSTGNMSASQTVSLDPPKTGREISYISSRGRHNHRMTLTKTMKHRITGKVTTQTFAADVEIPAVEIYTEEK